MGGQKETRFFGERRENERFSSSLGLVERSNSGKTVL
jgi:hypothetical protein